MKPQEAIQQLVDACDSLMGELAGKRATDWGLVNTALVNGREVLREWYARKHKAKTRNVRYGKAPSCPECERSFGPHYTGPCEH